MLMQEDLIVDISPEREKFFGTTGKMLKPCPATVSALVRQIPSNKLATTDQLRQTLAARAGVEVTCPADFSQALKAVAHDAGRETPFWRVIKKNGELMPKFPGGRDGHAARLLAEGFAIDTSRREPRVERFTEYLIECD